MGIEKHKHNISGHTYLLTTFGAKQGQRVLLRLAKILGPAAAEIVTKGDEGAPAAIQMALSAAAEEDFDYITDAFAESCSLVLTLTTAAGSRDADPVPLKGMYDTHFAGRYYDLGSWLFWCIERNFADFFGDKGIGALVKRRQVEQASPSASPQAPIGSSGVS